MQYKLDKCTKKARAFSFKFIHKYTVLYIFQKCLLDLLEKNYPLVYVSVSTQRKTYSDLVMLGMVRDHYGPIVFEILEFKESSEKAQRQN